MMPNDSILVTPGSGATVATHTISGKEYQIFMNAMPDGHLLDSKDTFMVWCSGNINIVNNVIGCIFNQSSTHVIRVRGIWIQPDMSAITGVQNSWVIQHLTSGGTSGSTADVSMLDKQNQSRLNSGVLCRYKNSGMVSDFSYFQINVFNDETNPSMMISYQNQKYMLMKIIWGYTQGLMVESVY